MNILIIEDEYSLADAVSETLSVYVNGTTIN